MNIKRYKLNELMKVYCAGNYNRFAREPGVSASQLHRFIQTGVGGGKKLLVSVIKFCKDRNLRFEDYIEV